MDLSRFDVLSTPCWLTADSWQPTAFLIMTAIDRFLLDQIIQDAKKE